MQWLPDGECVGNGIAHDAIDVGAGVEKVLFHGAASFSFMDLHDSL